MTLSLVERILPYERDIFLWLNSHHSPFWDSFMWLYSDKHTWIPLAIACAIIFVYKMKWKESLLLVLCGILLGFLCDYTSASIIKPFFERMRPTHHPDFEQVVITIRGYTGGKLGFVSAHAANGFGIAVFSSLLYRYRYYTITIFLWALTTCYSRIHLGVHFISDVVGGMMVGTIAGFIVYAIYQLARKRVLNVPDCELKTPVLTPQKAQVMIGCISLTLVYIIARSVYESI